MFLIQLIRFMERILFGINNGTGAEWCVRIFTTYKEQKLDWNGDEVKYDK